LGITAVLIITNRPTPEVMDGPLDFETLTAVFINIDINFQRGDVQLRQSI